MKLMMKYILMFLLSVSVYAQTLNVTAPNTTRMGSPVTLTISGSTMSNVAGVQWSTTAPTGWLLSSPVVGQAAIAATKEITCSLTNVVCLVYGLNQNQIGNGAVATLTLSAPANAVPGVYQVSLSGVVMASPSALAIAATAGPSVSITLLSPADINGDGKVDITDVHLMAGQVVAGVCSNDQNGDGKCDVTDVMWVILRALGL